MQGCELRGGTCRHGPAVCVCMGLGESPAESESESVAACLTSTDLRARETQTLRHGMEWNGMWNGRTYHGMARVTSTDLIAEALRLLERVVERVEPRLLLRAALHQVVDDCLLVRPQILRAAGPNSIE